MKQLLIIFFVSAFTTAYSQGKDDNTILAKNVTFEKACTVLLDNGFRIDKKDNDLLTATTEPKSISKNWILHMTVYIRVIDSIVKIQGTYTWGDLLKDEKVYYPTSKSGKPKLNNIGGIAWRALDDLAKAMSDDIEYKKE